MLTAPCDRLVSSAIASAGSNSADAGLLSKGVCPFILGRWQACRNASAKNKPCFEVLQQSLDKTIRCN
jgi:hypothetical protein